MWKAETFKIKDRLGHWARLQTILRVFAKHGFSEFLHHIGLHAAAKESASAPSIPERLRLAFEELGPSFIKLGQLLSTRPDLIPEDFIKEFSKLTDHAPQFPFTEALEILQQEFGRDPYEIFEWIDESPIAAASIAQAHRARLRDSDQHVIVKIQRPQIEKTIQSDIQVLHFIANSADKVLEDLRFLNLPAIVEEFQRSIQEELNFTLEAQNLSHFQSLLSESSKQWIVIPEVIWSASTMRVLTMTELPGTPLSQLSLFPDNINRRALAEAIVTFFFECIFVHGCFHADAHAGNLLLDPTDEGRLGLIDFGMIGKVGPELRKKLSKLFLALVTQDYESIAATYSDVGEFNRAFSLREFQNDIGKLLSPLLGKPLRDINIGEVLMESTRLAQKYHIRLPRDLVLFYRSLMTLEHIGRKLDPDFEFLTYGRKFAQTLLINRYSPEEILRDLFKTVEAWRSLGTEFPHQLKNMARQWDREQIVSSQELLVRLERTQRLYLWALLALAVALVVLNFR